MRTIVVAEDLGHGFWLDEGLLMAGAILADGSGFDDFPDPRIMRITDERITEIRTILHHQREASRMSTIFEGNEYTLDDAGHLMVAPLGSGLEPTPVDVIAFDEAQAARRHPSRGAAVPAARRKPRASVPTQRRA